jgi:hypothetical protein
MRAKADGRSIRPPGDSAEIYGGLGGRRSGEVVGCSAGRLVEPHGDCGRKISHDQLAGSVMPAMQSLAVRVDSSEIPSGLRTGDRRLHGSNGGVLEVCEIAVLAEQAEHSFEDVSNQRGRKVIEGEATDDVVESAFERSQLDRGLVQFDGQFGVALSKRLEQPLLEHGAEKRIDFDDVELVPGTDRLQNLRGEGAGSWSDLKHSLGFGRLAKRTGHLARQLAAARPHGAGVLEVSKCLRKEVKHG